MTQCSLNVLLDSLNHIFNTIPDNVKRISAVINMASISDKKFYIDDNVMIFEKTDTYHIRITDFMEDNQGCIAFNTENDLWTWYKRMEYHRSDTWYEWLEFVFNLFTTPYKDVVSSVVHEQIIVPCSAIELNPAAYVNFKTEQDPWMKTNVSDTIYNHAIREYAKLIINGEIQ